VRAAVEGAGDRTGVLVVTVLTSMDLGTASAAIGHPLAALRDEVLRLAEVAASAGAHGVVCAGGECSAVREKYGARIEPLVPGLRTGSVSGDDQSRVVTPEEAAKAGAAYVVIGRAATAAADPAKALEGILSRLE